MSTVLQLVNELWPYLAPPVLGHGLRHYSKAWRFVNGVAVGFDHNSKPTECMLDVPGGALGVLYLAEIQQLCRKCDRLGFRCTRIDVAVDFKGSTEGMIERVHASVAAGELCGARRGTVTSISGFDADGVSRMQTLYLGRRGSLGSGRYFRWYDKAVESGQHVPGGWVRGECAFSGQCSQQVCKMLCEAADDDMRAPLLSVWAGSFDYRQVVPGETAVKRRPRVAWWADLLGALSCVRVRSVRERAAADSYRKWFCSTAIVTLRAAAEDLDVSPGQLVALLLEEDRQVNPRRKHFATSNRRSELGQWVRERAPNLVRFAGSLASERTARGR